MGFTQFYDLSQEAADTDFQSTFSNTGLPGSSDLTSLSGEFGEMVKYIRMSLGEPVLTVEISNDQIAVAYERASLEYSRILSMLQISNYISSFLGGSKSYTDNDLKNILPYETFSFIRRYAKNYGIFGPNPVGGNVDIRRGYVSLTAGVQDYNIYTNLYDNETNQTIGQYVLSNTSQPSSIVISKLYHDQPTSRYRNLDPWNSTALMSSDFRIESYTYSQTSFYIMPVWNDVLRGQVLRQSDLVRKSNYSYNQMGNRLLIFPTPINSLKVYFEYFQDINAFETAGINTALENSSLSSSLSAGNNSSLSGISGIWNSPMTDIHYDEMNPMSRQWVREYALALSREMLGDIRSKYASIPLPNGDIQLNGNDLVQRAREDQTKLKEDLKTDLEQFKKENMMEKETKVAQQLNEQLKFFPLLIDIG